LTNNFARRFVMGGIVMIRISHRYLEDKAPRRGTPFVSPNARLKEIYDAKNNFDNSGLGLARRVNRPDRFGCGAL
jgi:hypothetical protein